MGNVPSSAGRSSFAESANLTPSNLALATVPEWLAARRARTPHAEDLAEPPERHEAPPASASATGTARRRIADAPPTLLISAVDSTSSLSAESLGNLLMRRPSRTAAIGVGASLVIHLVLLISLAIFVVMRGEVQPDIVVLAEFGNPGGDTILDPSLEASLPEVGGKEAPPLEFVDLGQPLSPDAISFIPGDALRGAVDGTGTGDGRGSGDGAGNGTGSGIGIPAVNVPSFAITKGSFSAWTEPRDPVPFQQYVIVIQVRVPKNIREYRGSDLTGMVTGTDTYKQVIRFKSTEKFPVTDGAVEVRVQVPGAAKLIRDTIRIESRLLKEKQTIRIEF